MKKYTIKKLVWTKDYKDSFVSQDFGDAYSSEYFTIEKQKNFWHCWYNGEIVDQNFTSEKEAMQKAEDSLRDMVEKYTDEVEG